jgi:hypothetical protein
MRNHFHWLVKIKGTAQVLKTCAVPSKKFNPAQGFSNFFNAYTKAINKGYGRTGSLFEERFGRIPVTSTSYFETLIFYIHFNPQKHGFVTDFRDWDWSSYHILIGSNPTNLKRDEVLRLFGGIQGFEEFHCGMVNEKKLAQFTDHEFDIETDRTGLKTCAVC